MENKTYRINYTGKGSVAGAIENVSEETINDESKLRELVRKEIKEKFPDASPEELHDKKMNVKDAPENFDAGVPLEIF